MHPAAQHKVIALVTFIIVITKRVQFLFNFLLFLTARVLIKSLKHPFAELVANFFRFYLRFGVCCLCTLTRAHEPVLQILTLSEAYHLLL
jgi:hypothetical protein